MNLIVLFLICNVANVILNTIKSIMTIKCGKMSASIISAITYGFYTYVIILTNCELALWIKCLIVALCNFTGVYIVKYFEEKARKERLWKIEFTVNCDYEPIDKALNVPHSYQRLGKHTMFTAYASTKADTNAVKAIIKEYQGKYFITENNGSIKM